MKKLIALIIIITGFIPFFIKDTTPKAEAKVFCTVRNAVITPHGEQPNTYYKEGSTHVEVAVITDNCAGKTIEFTMREADACIASWVPGANCNDSLSDADLKDRKIIVPTSEAFTIEMTAGEEACEAGPGFDCDYYFEIVTPDTDWSSYKNSTGNLFYECDGVCLDNWKFIKTRTDAPDPTPTPENWYYKNIFLLPNVNGGATRNYVGPYTSKPLCEAAAATAAGAGKPTFTCYLDGKDLDIPSEQIYTDANYNSGSTGTNNNGSNPNAYTIVPGTNHSFDPDYHLLAPIGDFATINDTYTLGDYLNKIFLLVIGLCAATAVVMIVFYGIQFMGDESVFGHTEAKQRITSIIGGLLLALGAYALLNTINKDLLGSNGFSINQVTVDIGGDTETPTNADPASVRGLGIKCDGTGGLAATPAIAQSFAGKMTYQFGGKGTTIQNGAVKLDCSGFVNYVLQCAGVNKISGGTQSIFTGAEAVNTIDSNSSINGKALNVGDLIGWKAGDNTGKYAGYGHVFIYIGGGNIADSHADKDPGQALGTFSLSTYKDAIKFIKRLN